MRTLRMARRRREQAFDQPRRGWHWAFGLALAAVSIAAAVMLLQKKLPAPAMSPAKTAANTEAPAPPPPKSVAVLPLTNLSPDPENAFFADGVHEDLLTSLFLVRDIKVLSRTSVLQYRDTKKGVRQIGEELGVAYIFEGSVSRSPTKVRVTGRLVRASTDEQVWADTLDRPLTDLFELRAMLAKEIAAGLKARLPPRRTRSSRSDRRRTSRLTICICKRGRSAWEVRACRRG